MDFDIFHKDVADKLGSKKALGIKVGIFGLLLLIVSLPIHVLSEMIGQLVFSIGILVGFAGVFIHLVLMFNPRK